MIKILKFIYLLLRMLPSNSFLNIFRGKVVSKLAGGKCTNLKIAKNVIFVNFHNIFIGENVIINPDVVLIATTSKIIIGDDVLIAPKVFIQTQNHNFKRKDILIRFQGETMKDVIIGDDVWIAYGVIVLPGSYINKGCVVGAGSIVTSELLEYSINAGIPAKKISMRT